MERTMRSPINIAPACNGSALMTARCGSCALGVLVCLRNAIGSFPLVPFVVLLAIGCCCLDRSFRAAAPPPHRPSGTNPSFLILFLSLLLLFSKYYCVLFPFFFPLPLRSSRAHLTCNAATHNDVTIGHSCSISAFITIMPRPAVRVTHTGPSEGARRFAEDQSQLKKKAQQVPPRGIVSRDAEEEKNPMITQKVTSRGEKAGGKQHINVTHEGVGGLVLLVTSIRLNRPYCL